jgi:hypothetical protein
MLMETVSLSTIVLSFIPEWRPFFRESDLNQMVVLRDGLDKLEHDGAKEIIEEYIYQQQKDAALH